MGRDESEEESEYSGNTSDSDEDHRTGFKSTHRCTDPICCLIFVAALVAFTYVYIWGEVHSDLRKLSHGLDRDGRICGVSAGVESQPYVYYCPSEWNILNWSLSVDAQQPICVPSCPGGPNSTVSTDNCSAGSVPYSTVMVADWYCLPSKSRFSKASVDLQKHMDNFNSEISGGLFGIKSSWPVMLLVIVVATAMGYVYLCLLRAVAKGLIWLCLGLAVAVLLGFGYYLWVQSSADVAEHFGDDQGDAVRKYSKALAVLVWLSAFALACLTCCCHGEVELSTACVRSGTEVIWKMPLLLLAPLIKAIMKCTLAFVFFIGFIHLWSTATVTGSGTRRYYDFSNEQYIYLAIYIVVAVWVLSFVTALYQFAIAYAVAKYYETAPDEDGDRDADCLGIVEGGLCGLRYHTGSLAFGAALMTVMELFQKVLLWAEAKNKEAGDNKVVACVLSTCLCCCACIEQVVKFVGKNAYIEIAISSSGFCRAVRNVGHVVLEHGAAMAILNSATVVFQIVGIGAITAICGLLANVVLKSDTFSKQDSDHFVQNRALATVAACIIGLIVAWAFMAVFDVATDTLLICMAQDMMQHNGQAVKAPEKMKQLYVQAQQKLEKKNRERAKLEARMRAADS